MKHCFTLILLLGFLSLSAQVFETETIKNTGDNDKRINLVILSEGYQASELAKFKTDATNFVNAMFNQSPFKEYTSYFNVHIIKVPSNQSGADHPGTATDVTEPAEPVTFVDTYFNATFDAFGYHRLLYYEIDGFSANNTQAKIYSVLADNFPTYDQALILVNSSIYGGSGGLFPMASLATSANEIAIHELGHSMFNLKDEYHAPGYEAEAINMTQETNPSLVKWKNWMGINSVGIYAYGTTGVAATWYRPHQNCKMRYLGVPFCAVCKEGMVEKIHSLQSPIDAFTPTSNTISSNTFPLDFQLNLIKPVPNTLTSKWILNNVDFATNVDAVSVLENNLNSGTNTLSVSVHDETSLLKVTNHNTVHLYTVTWTINNTSLGIKDITSTIANYAITMHPNPTNGIVNFNFESDNTSKLNVKILSLEGKLIKTLTLTNYTTQQVDISNLNKGIYLVNFYTNKQLITSKKLVVN